MEGCGAMDMRRVLNELTWGRVENLVRYGKERSIKTNTL